MGRSKEDDVLNTTKQACSNKHIIINQIQDSHSKKQVTYLFYSAIVGCGGVLKKIKITKIEIEKFTFF